MQNRKSKIGNRKSGFTLVEILVAIGVFAILGTALVGLMSAAVDAWRRGEASRQVNETFQALQRQLTDDLAAAVVDPPPPPDFHFALDTLADLPTDPNSTGHPYPNIVDDYDASSIDRPSAPASGTPEADTRQLTYFAATSTKDKVVLKIPVPFRIGSALLKARLDVLDPTASATLLVARNDPDATDPTQRDTPPAESSDAWKQMDSLSNAEGIGGGETNVTPAVLGGTIVFIMARLDGAGAQFLRGDKLRPGGRPVLVLDCYRAINALPAVPRPTFAAFYRNGAQVITFTRTLPLDAEGAAAQNGNYTGRAQVVYRIQPYHVTLSKPGLGVLRRAYEAPLRSRAYDPGPPAKLSPNIIRLVDDITDPAKTPGADQAFIPNVLHFAVSFWGHGTDTWEDRPDFDPNPPTNPAHPADTVWLSSRYLPEQARITAALEPSRGHRTTTGLSYSLAADFPAANPDRLYVHSTQGFDSIVRPTPVPFLRDARHYIKVDDEWIFYSGIDASGAFGIPRVGSDGFAARGARGTRRVSHAAGTEVYRGITSAFTVPIPASRPWER